MNFEFTDDSKLKKSGSLILVLVGGDLSHNSRLTTLGSLRAVLLVHGFDIVLYRRSNGKSL